MEEQFKKIWGEKDESGFKEKHAPVLSIDEKEMKISVAVGKVEHPSETSHFIQWIELLDEEISLEKIYLSPFSKPKAVFYVKEMPRNMKVRIFCNLHGTWQSL
ncbi:hypothetical protein HYW76_03280 [Candidatus Pacearchaeota archaeon]|nr:hypothetical protein [Candidatus Pacearchaeota archaeon]